MGITGAGLTFAKAAGSVAWGGMRGGPLGAAKALVKNAPDLVTSGKALLPHAQKAMGPMVDKMQGQATRGFASARAGLASRAPMSAEMKQSAREGMGKFGAAMRGGHASTMAAAKARAQQGLAAASAASGGRVPGSRAELKVMTSAFGAKLEAKTSALDGRLNRLAERSFSNNTVSSSPPSSRSQGLSASPVSVRDLRAQHHAAASSVVSSSSSGV
jgi:hypothetical protein